MKAFANESASLAIGGLTIENRTDRVQLYGQLHLTRDKAGLADAKALKAILDGVVEALEGQPDLPEEIPVTNAPRPAKNPFAKK
jgi:hypothetical protein